MPQIAVAAVQQRRMPSSSSATLGLRRRGGEVACIPRRPPTERIKCTVLEIVGRHVKGCGDRVGGMRCAAVAVVVDSKGRREIVHHLLVLLSLM